MITAKDVDGRMVRWMAEAGKDATLPLGDEDVYLRSPRPAVHRMECREGVTEMALTKEIIDHLRHGQVVLVDNYKGPALTWSDEDFAKLSGGLTPKGMSLESMYEWQCASIIFSEN